MGIGDWNDGMDQDTETDLVEKGGDHFFEGGELPVRGRLGKGGNSGCLVIILIPFVTFAAVFYFSKFI
jgi:hypothetical protein